MLLQQAYQPCAVRMQLIADDWVQVLQQLPDEERRSLTPIELRQRARDFALKTVDSQRAQFKRYGVWGDWDTPYVTLQPEYEAAQIGVFGKVPPRSLAPCVPASCAPLHSIERRTVLFTLSC